MSNLIYTLGNKKIPKAECFPVLGFMYLDCHIDFNEYDLLVITSQNALLAIKNDKQQWINKKILTVGQATQELAIQMGALDVVCSSVNNAKSMILENISLIQSRKTLYLRGKRVSTDIKSILKLQNINIYEKIVYENFCNIDNISLKIEKNSWVILSSPFIVECFCNNFDLQDYKIMLFGKKLFKKMPKHSKYQISPKDTIKDTVEYILSNK